jgi:HEAT repeat protein
MALLDNGDYRLREVAAWWIARRPAQKAEIHELSVARLYGNDADLARNAADTLGTFRHPQALPALRYAVTRTDFPGYARAAAVKAIGTIGDPAGEAAIVGAFADADAQVRLAAVQALFSLRGTRTGDALIPLLGDGSVDVRRRATAVMGTLKAVSARAQLENLLANDSDSLVRRNAAFALGRLGDVASRPALELAAQNDPSSLVQSVARASIRSLR